MLNFEDIFQTHPAAKALQVLYEHVPCCGKIIDGEARLLSMSSLGQEIMQVEDFEALRGSDWLQVWQGEDWRKANEAFAFAKTQGYSAFSGFAYTALGNPRWWNVQLIRIPHEHAEYYFVLSQDITAKVELGSLQERTLAQPAEVAWSSSLEHGLVEFDMQGAFVKANEIAREWLGLDDKRDLFKSFGILFRQSLIRLTQSDDVEHHLGDVPYALTSERWKHFAVRFRKKLSIQGDPLSIQCVLQDSSERMRMMHALEQLYELSPNMIMISDREGVVQKVNPAWAQVFGEEEAFEMMGRKFLDYVHPDDLQMTLKEFARIADGGAASFFANRYLSKSRGHVWLGWSAAVSTDGQTIFGVAMDISSQKELEAAMRRSNMTLLRHKEQLDLFARISSHDLQEPLRKQRVFLDRLKDSLGPEPSGQQLMFIDRAERSAARMSKVIMAILEFSRVDGDTPEHLEECSLLGLLKDAASTVDFAPEDICSIHVPPLITLVANRTQLSLAFTHVMDNAVEFSRSSHPLELVITASCQDGLVHLDFEDNGIGIDPKYAKKIFEPLQRISSKGQGLGIGLALCRKIITSHRGTIGFTPRATGQGSCFSVALPQALDAHLDLATTGQWSLPPATQSRMPQPLKFSLEQE